MAIAKAKAARNVENAEHSHEATMLEPEPEPEEPIQGEQAGRDMLQYYRSHSTATCRREPKLHLLYYSPGSPGWWIVARGQEEPTRHDETQRWVRVAVIGHAKCGKTNLVMRLAQNVYAGTRSRQREAGLADPLPPIKLEGPLQQEQSPEHFREVTKLIIHDTAWVNAIWEQTDGLLHSCDVIVVAFDARSHEEESENLARAETEILARLKNTPIVCDKPVVLVGTMTDCRKDDTDASAASSAQARQLVEKYPSIEVFIHCSARTGLRVADIFWHARRMCLYPNGPLQKRHKELTVGCKFALRHVFRMCQKERAVSSKTVLSAEVLSNDEIKAFQALVFGQPLSDAELDAVKRMVKDHARRAD
jgi:GTPase SAR1 family protein